MGHLLIEHFFQLCGTTAAKFSGAAISGLDFGDLFACKNSVRHLGSIPKASPATQYFFLPSYKKRYARDKPLAYHLVDRRASGEICVFLPDAVLAAHPDAVWMAPVNQKVLFYNEMTTVHCAYPEGLGHVRTY